MVKYRIVEHLIIAQNLTREEAEKIVKREESVADSNEVWFEVQEE